MLGRQSQQYFPNRLNVGCERKGIAECLQGFCLSDWTVPGQGHNPGMLCWVHSLDPCCPPWTPLFILSGHHQSCSPQAHSQAPGSLRRGSDVGLQCPELPKSHTAWSVWLQPKVKQAGNVTWWGRRQWWRREAIQYLWLEPCLLSLSIFHNSPGVSLGQEKRKICRYSPGRFERAHTKINFIMSSTAISKMRFNSGSLKRMTRRERKGLSQVK